MENLQYQDIRSYLVMLIFVYNSYCDFIIFNCMEYTLPFKSMGSERFEMFLKNNFFCSPNLHLFDTKYSKNINIVKYYYIWK